MSLALDQRRWNFNVGTVELEVEECNFWSSDFSIPHVDVFVLVSTMDHPEFLSELEFVRTQLWALCGCLPLVVVRTQADIARATPAAAATLRYLQAFKIPFVNTSARTGYQCGLVFETVCKVAAIFRMVPANS
jgi:hypothetical protein